MGAIWQEANDKPELLAQIEAEHARLVRLIEEFPAEKRLLPLFGKLSLKDIVAHITEWETYALHRIRSAALGEILPLRVPDGNYDRANAEIYAMHKDRVWQDVWLDFTRTYEEVVAEVRTLSEYDLFDADRAGAVVGLPARKPEDTAARFIAGNSSNHYWEHANEIEALRAG